MDCALYFDASLVVFVFILIGLIIGVLLICISLVLYTNYKNSDKVAPHASYEISNLVNSDNSAHYIITHNKFNINNYAYPVSNIDNINNTRLSNSDVLIKIKDLTSCYDFDFQYLNNRLRGYMYVTQQMINLLFKKKYINEEDYNYYVEQHSKTFQSKIKSFNENYDKLIRNLESNYNEISCIKELDLEIQKVDQLLPKANIMINDIIHSQKCENRSLLEKLQQDNKITEDKVNDILNMLSIISQKLENLLNKSKQKVDIKNKDRLKNLNINLKNVQIDENVNCNGYKQREEMFIKETLDKIISLSKINVEQISEELHFNIANIRKKYNDELNLKAENLKTISKQTYYKEIEKVSVALYKELSDIHKKMMNYTSEDFNQFLNNYHSVVEKIDNKVLNKLIQFDQAELDEYLAIKNKIDASINREINQHETQLIQKVCEEINSDHSDIQKFINNHNINVANFESNLKKEKAKQKEKMNQLLNIINQELSDELFFGIQDLFHEDNKLDALFKMTIDNQTSLPMDLKRRIIEDGKSDGIAVQNQIVSAKERQRKMMELALSKKIQEKNKLSNENDFILLPNEIEIYENLLKESKQEKSQILYNHRNKLVEDTKLALGQQEDHMAKIMAKYIVSFIKKNKRKKILEDLYESLWNEINKIDKSFAASTIFDQFINEKIFIENRMNLLIEQQKERLRKQLFEKEEKVKNEKLETYHKKLQELIDLQNSGTSKEAFEFVNEKMTDKISKSVKDVKNEIKQNVFEETENLEGNLEAIKLDKQLMNKTVEALSKIIHRSKISKDEIIDLINKINPNIDNKIKMKVIREIYGRKSKLPDSDAENEENYGEFHTNIEKNKSSENLLSANNLLSSRKRNRKKKQENFDNSERNENNEESDF